MAIKSPNGQVFSHSRNNFEKDRHVATTNHKITTDFDEQKLTAAIISCRIVVYGNLYSPSRSSKI